MGRDFFLAQWVVGARDFLGGGGGHIVGFRLRGGKEHLKRGCCSDGGGEVGLKRMMLILV